MRTLLFLAFAILLQPVRAEVELAQVDSIPKYERIEDMTKELDEGIAELDKLRQQAEAREAAREAAQENQRLSRYFFPWGIVASYALCAFLYWRPKLLPAFFYRELWLTVTLIGLAILWWPVIFMLDATNAGDEFLIPKMLGDTVQLILVIALGYGVFLLTRKHIKPVE